MRMRMESVLVETGGMGTKYLVGTKYFTVSSSNLNTVACAFAVADSCKWCCRDLSAPNSSCLPYQHHKLPEGMPCVWGYCSKVRCRALAPYQHKISVSLYYYYYYYYHYYYYY